MFVVVSMYQQRLNQVKLCSTFDAAVETAVEIIKQEWLHEKNAKELLVSNKACYSIDRSVHIGEL